MTKTMMIEAAEDHGPTIREENTVWWWADESWEWHGPCSSEKSARRRQTLYVSCCLEGFPHVTNQTDWEARIEREKEGDIHPCHTWAPWDCECSGVCSCHWEENDDGTSETTGSMERPL